MISSLDADLTSLSEVDQSFSESNFRYTNVTAAPRHKVAAATSGVFV